MYTCPHCERTFNDNSNRCKHVKKCKGLPQDPHILQNLVRKHQTELTRLQNENRVLKEFNARLTKELSNTMNNEEWDKGEEPSAEGECIPAFFGMDVNHYVSMEDITAMWDMPASESIIKIIERLYFQHSSDGKRKQNIYLKSTKCNTVEIYDKTKWIIMAKHHALNIMVKRAGDCILQNYSDSEHAERELQAVLSGDKRLTDTYRQNILDIMWLDHREPTLAFHRVRQKIWAQIQSRGKRVAS